MGLPTWKKLKTLSNLRARMYGYANANNNANNNATNNATKGRLDGFGIQMMGNMQDSRFALNGPINQQSTNGNGNTGQMVGNSAQIMGNNGFNNLAGNNPLFGGNNAGGNMAGGSGGSGFNGYNQNPGNSFPSMNGFNGMGNNGNGNMMNMRPGLNGNGQLLNNGIINGGNAANGSGGFNGMNGVNGMSSNGNSMNGMNGMSSNGNSMNGINSMNGNLMNGMNALNGTPGLSKAQPIRPKTMPSTSTSTMTSSSASNITNKQRYMKPMSLKARSQQLVPDGMEEIQLTTFGESGGPSFGKKQLGHFLLWIIHSKNINYVTNFGVRGGKLDDYKKVTRFSQGLPLLLGAIKLNFAFSDLERIDLKPYFYKFLHASMGLSDYLYLGTKMVKSSNIRADPTSGSEFWSLRRIKSCLSNGKLFIICCDVQNGPMSEYPRTMLNESKGSKIFQTGELLHCSKDGRKRELSVGDGTHEKKFYIGEDVGNDDGTLERELFGDSPQFADFLDDEGDILEDDERSNTPSIILAPPNYPDHLKPKKSEVVPEAAGREEGDLKVGVKGKPAKEEVMDHLSKISPELRNMLEYLAIDSHYQGLRQLTQTEEKDPKILTYNVLNMALKEFPYYEHYEAKTIYKSMTFNEAFDFFTQLNAGVAVLPSLEASQTVQFLFASKRKRAVSGETMVQLHESNIEWNVRCAYTGVINGLSKYICGSSCMGLLSPHTSDKVELESEASDEDMEALGVYWPVIQSDSKALVWVKALVLTMILSNALPSHINISLVRVILGTTDIEVIKRIPPQSWKYIRQLRRSFCSVCQDISPFAQSAIEGYEPMVDEFERFDAIGIKHEERFKKRIRQQVWNFE